MPTSVAFGLALVTLVVVCLLSAPLTSCAHEVGHGHSHHDVFFELAVDSMAPYAGPMPYPPGAPPPAGTYSIPQAGGGFNCRQLLSTWWLGAHATYPPPPSPLVPGPAGGQNIPGMAGLIVVNTTAGARGFWTLSGTAGEPPFQNVPAAGGVVPLVARPAPINGNAVQYRVRRQRQRASQRAEPVRPTSAAMLRHRAGPMECRRQ